MVTVAELTVNSLLDSGATTVHCLPGVQNDEFFDALHGVGDRLQVVHTRHEQGAGYMAMGAALATGRSQVFCVVPGPGFLNSTAALATACATGARVLAIIGEIPSVAIGRGFGLLHEIPDQTGILEQLTKFTGNVTGGSAARNVLSDVMTALERGKPYPVGLNVPTDMWKQCAPEAADQVEPAAVELPAVDGNRLDRAVEILRNAERPLIVVGGGAQAGATQVRRFTRALSAPATAFRNGHGVVPSDDPLFVSFPVAHELWGRADVVIGLGTRLQSQQMQWGVDDDLKIIHIDIDKAAIGRIHDPEVGLHGDLAQVLPMLTTEIEGRCRDRGSWLSLVDDIRGSVGARIEAKLSGQLSYLRAIRQELPRNGIFVDEITQMGYAAKFAFPCYEPRTFLSAGYQGNLGFGFPTALGAANARRDVPVVSISGDGGFMYAVGELSTAVRHSIPLKMIVFRDNAFGNVRRIQQELYGGRLLGVDLVNPDFVLLARNFGIGADRAGSPAELKTALRKAIGADGPFLIEVPVGEFASPWEFILMPLVRARRPVGRNEDMLF